jgi:L-fuculose-phosphate aldolase
MNVATARAIRSDVIVGVRRLVAERLVIGTTGNVSGRAEDRIVITPTRTSYDTLGPDQLVEVELSSGRERPEGRASRELPLHLATYAERQDVSAVVHTHSPHATAWSFLNLPLEPVTEEFSYYDIGRVMTCSGGAGTTALAQAAAEALTSANGVLLAGHGVVTVGETVEAAVTRAAAIEHAAQIAFLLRNACRCTAPAR